MSTTLANDIDSCGFACAVEKLEREDEKYEKNRTKILSRRHTFSEPKRKMLSERSQYLRGHSARHQVVLDTSRLYQTDSRIINPNSSATLEFGGEDYADLMENQIQVQKIQDLLDL